MSESKAATSKIWQSQDYLDCRDLFKQLIDEGLSVGRIVKESSISIELARRCASDLGITIGKASSTASGAAAASGGGANAAGVTLQPPSQFGAGASSAATQARSSPAQGAGVASHKGAAQAGQASQAESAGGGGAGVTAGVGGANGAAQPKPRVRTARHSCPYGCGKEYVDKSGLDYHLTKGKCEVRDAQANAVPEQTTYLCKAPGCPSRFTTLEGLTHHLNSAHGQFGQELAKAMAS